MLEDYGFIDEENVEVEQYRGFEERVQVAEVKGEPEQRHTHKRHRQDHPQKKTEVIEHRSVLADHRVDLPKSRYRHFVGGPVPP
jgi:hypothetical protein